MINTMNILAESRSDGKLEGEGVSYEHQIHKNFIFPYCAFICLP